MKSQLDPKRTVTELKELRALTGDENGAQRVAFTETWAKARKWLRSKVEDLRGVEIHNDEAGDFWATLRGTSEKAFASRHSPPISQRTSLSILRTCRHY